MTDKIPGACQCHEEHAPTYWKSVVREYKGALEKAVRERDEALADAESRPLTPDDITDEMIERGRSAYWGPTFGGSVVGRVRAILAAALTEPPARPEGAGDIEAVLREEWSFSDEGGGEEAFADLAERLAKRGVRVVGEEQP